VAIKTRTEAKKTLGGHFRKHTKTMLEVLESPVLPSRQRQKTNLWSARFLQGRLF
jgi:hypothetical protein